MASHLSVLTDGARLGHRDVLWWVPIEMVLKDHLSRSDVRQVPADNATVRSVFVVGPDKKIKLMLTYPMTTGRNFDKLLRAIDSIQLTAKHQVATPAQWKHGEDVIITPAVSDEDAEKRFGSFERVLPYLRKTKMPTN